MAQRCPSCGVIGRNPNARYCEGCGVALWVAPGPQPPGSVGQQPGPTRPQPAGWPQLHVDWPGGSQAWHLDRPELTIGREGTNDIIIDFPTVSRKHAKLERHGYGYRIVDLNSLNGLTWAGRRVHEVVLGGGEVIRIGDGEGSSVTLRYEGDAKPGVVDVAGGKPVALACRRAVTIGRAPENDLVLADPMVSAGHARLEDRGGRHVLVDLNSMNGTRVNGQPVTSRLLSPGDVIQLGTCAVNYDGSTLHTSVPSGSDYSESHQAVPVELDLAPGMSEVVIGRDPNCDVFLNHPGVSRRHARLTPRGGQRVLTDLGSTNGTFVNGEAITDRLLRSGDVIQIGPFALNHVTKGLTSRLTAGGKQVEAHNLRRVVKGEKGPKVILNDVSLTIAPNEFVALVGGSGTGKSTLLMALNGFSRAKGRVLVDDDDFYSHFDAYRAVIGYVPQSDIIHRSLPVERALGYVARLRLPPDLRAHERRRRILEVLEKVDMVKCKDQVVSKLSGGERKRVSTAVELLAGPKMLFLDEPTSGLDPGLDKRLMYTFRELAQEGRTVVIVTHATANIHHCDHVAFLAPGGRLVWFGPPDQSLHYFGVTDFADIYTEIEKDPEGYEARFRHSPEYKRYVIDRRLSYTGQRGDGRGGAAPKPRPRLLQLPRQFAILTQRYVELVCRDARNLMVLLLQAPLIGLLLYLVAEQGVFENVALEPTDPKKALNAALQAQTVAYVLANVAVWFGVINAVREITKEMAIYLRERMANLGILPYVFSKVGVLAGLSLLQTAVLLGFVLWRTGYPAAGVVLSPGLDLYITLFLTAMAALGLALFVSSLAANQDRAMSWVPIVLLPQLILAGVSFRLENQMEVLSHLTLSYWSTLALGSIIDVCGQLPEECANGRIHLAYEHSQDLVLGTWGVLAGFTVLFLVLTTIVLKRKDRI